MVKNSNLPVLVDAHVHLRTNFSIEKFLETAFINFKEMSEQFTNKVSFVGVLFLADTAEDNGFKRLVAFLRANKIYNKVEQAYWRLLKINTNNSLVLSIDKSPIIIVASRQLLSTNDLEILAIGTSHSFRQDILAEDLINDIYNVNAFPIIPWGVGKWLGKRGKIVSQLLQNSNLPPFFIGDSANRPLFWPEPSQFRIARENGIKNLPGSDPLPVKNGDKNVGRAGILVKHQIDPDEPVISLQKILLDPTSDIQPYMKRENSISFFRNQFAMQYKKYFGDENRQKS